jgi:hypothetical protein
MDGGSDPEVGSVGEEAKQVLPGGLLGKKAGGDTECQPEDGSQ